MEKVGQRDLRPNPEDKQIDDQAYGARPRDVRERAVATISMGLPQSGMGDYAGGGIDFPMARGGLLASCRRQVFPAEECRREMATSLCGKPITRALFETICLQLAPSSRSAADAGQVLGAAKENSAIADRRSGIAVFPEDSLERPLHDRLLPAKSFRWRGQGRGRYAPV